MPKPLSSFQVASDCVVSLRYHDDQTFLASARAVSGLVPGHDYRKIKRSLKLRQDYINKHLPSWAKVLIVVVAIAVVSTGAVEAARLLTERFWGPPDATTTQGHDGLKLETERSLIVVPPARSNQGTVTSNSASGAAAKSLPNHATLKSEPAQPQDFQSSARGQIRGSQKLLRENTR